MRANFVILSSIILIFFCFNYKVVQAGFEIGTNPASGKVYFGDNTRRTWDEARTFCESQNPPMTLAAIEEEEGAAVGDWAFLESVWSHDFDGWYWTAGEDRRGYAQYTWYPQDIPVSADIGPGPMEWMVSRSCLMLNSKQGLGTSHTLAAPCEATNGFALCQHF